MLAGTAAKAAAPLHRPLPSPDSAPLDGFYAKIELKEGAPVPCKPTTCQKAAY
jgi:hypothetical protein